MGASADHVELLEEWRDGRADRRQLYASLRATLYQAARQGIRSITKQTPDDQDTEDVVYNAFVELERKDPAEVTSLAGLAKRIAYCRGQDRGRSVIRRRRQVDIDLADPAIRAELEIQESEIVIAAEQEDLLVQAVDCLEKLTNDQQDVVKSTVMGEESLSDWAFRRDKSHQSASRQRLRALSALRRCVDAAAITVTTKGGNHDRTQ